MNKQPPFPVLLALDPSVNRLGWALHNLNVAGERYEVTGDAWRFGYAHPRKHELGLPGLPFVWGSLFAQLRRVACDDWRPTHLAIEYPQFFASERGRIAAVQGDTLALASVAGYLAGRFAVPFEFIELWTPAQWKGSVPKSVTQEKFLRLFGAGARSIARQFPDDTIDAIMIAEHWLTLYHREKFHWLTAWRETRSPFFKVIRRTAPTGGMNRLEEVKTSAVNERLLEGSHLQEHQG